MKKKEKKNDLSFMPTFYAHFSILFYQKNEFYLPEKYKRFIFFIYYNIAKRVAIAQCFTYIRT